MSKVKTLVIGLVLGVVAAASAIGQQSASLSKAIKMVPAARKSAAAATVNSEYVNSYYLGYDLAICNACGRYLKERGGALRHELIVERTLVATLDEAAQLRGLRA